MRINTKFPSPNYSARTKTIEYIVVHFTEIPFEEALIRLTNAEAQVSTHYLIKKDGEIFQLVSDDKIAWHAGKSYWQGQQALNQNSIGIELDNLGDSEFTIEQMQSCLALCKMLMEKYNIASTNFIGHSDLAPNRKIDPGIFFDWEGCAREGLGIWHELDEPKNNNLLFSFGDKGENIKSLQQNLGKLGYELTTNGIFDSQTNGVIRAFQSKFCPIVIRSKGLDFYNDFKSQYNWDSFSDSILNKLVLKNFS